MTKHRVGLQRVHNRFGRDECSEWHTSAKRLCKADNIGCNTIFHAGKHLARATHSGLYLIEDEQCANLVATLAQSLQIALHGWANSRLALNRLAQHAGGLFGYLLQIVERVEIQGSAIGQEWAEGVFPLLALGLSHHTHRSVGRAVIGSAHRYHLGAVGISLRQLQRSLDRLGSRIEEIDALQIARQRLGNLHGILHLWSLDHLAIDHNVHISLRLRLYRLDNISVGVAYIAHRHSRNEVEIAFSFGGVEEYTLGTLHAYKHRRRRSLGNICEKLTTKNLCVRHIFIVFR